MTSVNIFINKAKLNHVLVQIYNNTLNNNKGKKAKIKEHSDKTKDMPINGIMAFVSFYNKKLNNDVNTLSKIRFRLKKIVKFEITKIFDVTLYPNSVLIIPLLTNRLYTHEIIPSILPIDKIPTRIGYLIRCSKTKAVFKNGQTYINKNGNHIKLEEMDEKNSIKVKNLYFQENMSDAIIFYGDIYHSFNEGDYKEPIL